MAPVSTRGAVDPETKPHRCSPDGHVCTRCGVTITFRDGEWRHHGGPRDAIGTGRGARPAGGCTMPRHHLATCPIVEAAAA